MGLGKMSYTEALECANNLSKNAEDLRTHLLNLRAEINSMDEVLVSNGATQLLSTYNDLDKELIKCPVKIEIYEAYLREAVEKYQNSDNQLKQEGK